MRYVFYHKSCADGMGAAWAAYQKFGKDDTRYYPKQWDDPPGYVKPRSEIFCVDFSFRRNELLKLVEDGHSVTVIDHHETMRDQIADLPFAIFDMTKSGAMLSWEHFHGVTPPPKLIRSVDAGDLWN